ncbi:MAG: ABC transporter substrate-binding protein, partial [Hyphomicrobiaceae bacterium]
DSSPSGTQGFFLNVRRKKFQDIRVRKALDYAFDFEWTRKTLFFGAYERTESYFENSDMKAVGEPTPAELTLLEPHRDKLPAAVFGKPYSPPVSNGSGFDRKLLRTSRKLLQEAGFTFRNGKAFDPNGNRFSIEFLIFSPGFEKIISFYANNLKKMGIEATIRRVDPAQYERRSKTFDFDIIVQRYTLRLTPGPELRAYWGSQAAKTNGSFNLAGIADPVVDALIEKVLQAKDRDRLKTATRALDRVLRAGHYWVSNWYNKTHRMAYWNKFARPGTKPLYNRGVIETWWVDPAKAAKLAQQ